VILARLGDSRTRGVTLQASGGVNVAVPLLANTLATGAALVALILTSLVHRLPVVCEPGCDTRALRDRSRCRHPS